MVQPEQLVGIIAKGLVDVPPLPTSLFFLVFTLPFPYASFFVGHLYGSSPLDNPWVSLTALKPIIIHSWLPEQVAQVANTAGSRHGTHGGVRDGLGVALVADGADAIVDADVTLGLVVPVHEGAGRALAPAVQALGKTPRKKRRRVA